MAELSLSFFILFLFNQSEKYLWWSGISGGLAVLTALEYGVALNLAVAAVCFFSFFSATRIIRIYFKKFIFGQLIILLPFFFWLLINRALRNYWDFTLAFVNNFYYASPCSGDSFPRLENISQLRPTSKLLVFNLPIEFLQQVNFYLVVIFLVSLFLFLLIRLIIKRKFSRSDLIKLSLTIYGLVISLRTLDNPCTGYFSYSLVPFFLLLALLIDRLLSWIKKRKSVGLKAIGITGIMIIFAWFLITEYTGTLVQIFGKKEAPVKKEVVASEFYRPAGWFIKKDYVRDYQEVVNYIKKHSEKEDFLYVYPWGPYNQLANRKSPTSLTNALQVGIAGEKFMEMTEKELIMKKPKLIVINLFNNLGTVRYGLGRGDVARYFSWLGEEGPVFVGDGSLIERFILTNYRPVLKNDLAVVMEPRVEPIMIPEKKKEIFSKKNWLEGEIELVSMKKTNQPNQYAVIGKKASWTYLLEKPIEAMELNIDLKLDGDFLTKHLSRYFLNIEVVTADTEESHLTKSLAWKDWQTV
ncbi:MAG: hypothetical protein MUP45_03870 [Candidatus Marinimicrobia bacterium]|nr:hypothetical protein [Candidatus Neomarinimicrobiota bacterium]